jgi:hypothetical protein
MTISNVSKSPERHTFQKNNYIKRCNEEGNEPDPSIIEMYESWASDDVYENRPEADLEFDLRTCDWILAKARASESYAQNIYASMCNIRWQRLQVLPILKDQFWSASWRSAGGIVADMLQQGDYIDWYCSGMGGLSGDWDKDSESFEEWQSRTKYVPEGVVTEEIREDFQKLGWVPSEWPDDN